MNLISLNLKKTPKKTAK